MADPMSKQVDDALVPLLKGIKVSAGYFHTLKNVTTDYTEVTSLRDEHMPLIQLGFFDFTDEVEAWPLVTVTFSRELIMSLTNVDGVAPDMHKLLSDVKKILATDDELGGLAHNLRVTGGVLNVKVNTGHSLESRILVEGTFWHKEDDPTTGRG